MIKIEPSQVSTSQGCGHKRLNVHSLYCIQEICVYRTAFFCESLYFISNSYAVS